MGVIQLCAVAGGETTAPNAILCSSPPLTPPNPLAPPPPSPPPSHHHTAGLAPELPEDLYHLIKKAVAMRKHLDGNRADKDGKFHLILVESRIHRLARYYKRTKKLPPTWKYESSTATALIQG